MPEYYVHILNWGPIEANSPEDAAREMHYDLKSGVNPVYIVTREEGSLIPCVIGSKLFSLKETVDSEEWFIEDEDGKDGTNGSPS